MSYGSMIVVPLRAFSANVFIEFHLGVFDSHEFLHSQAYGHISLSLCCYCQVSLHYDDTTCHVLYENNYFKRVEACFMA